MLIADEWKHETDLYCKSNVEAINLVHSFILGEGANHGHLERTAYKLSATKIEHSHW